MKKFLDPDWFILFGQANTRFGIMERWNGGSSSPTVSHYYKIYIKEFSLPLFHYFISGKNG
jgi:hypothetical protein